MSNNDLSIGAGGALAWIAQKEVEGRKTIERLELELKSAEYNIKHRPPELDGQDFDKDLIRVRRSLDDAMEAQFRLIRQLRDLDKSVDPSKRDTKETITREAGSALFAMFTIYMRTAVERFKEGIIPRIRESKTDADAYEIVEKELSGCMENSLKSAVAEQHLPEWAKTAVENVL